MDHIQWGCKAYVHVPSERVDAQSLTRGIFLRVFNRLYNPETQKILESRDVHFIEIENVSSLVGAQVRRTSEQEPLSDKYLPLRRVPYVEPDELEESTMRTMMSPPVGDVQEPEPLRLRRSTRVILRPYYLTYIAHGVAPDETPALALLDAI